MIPLPSGRFALVIGDVQGHDVRAAGLMGQLRIALRAYASEGHRPDAVLSRASRFLNGLRRYGRRRRRGPRGAALRDLPVRRGRPGDRRPGHRPGRAIPTRR
ncbi:hypothetical protein SBADM41S_11348 [Streptomyces badius]